MIDIREIMSFLPHGYPFLLIDRILEIEPGKRIVGIKNVTYNEPYFPGHFPGRPIMPGVLIVEAMAQTAGVLAFKSIPEEGQRRPVLFLGLDNVRFRKPVVPGDQLILISETIRAKKRLAICKCFAMVGDVMAAEAEIKFMLVDEEQL